MENSRLAERRRARVLADAGASPAVVEELLVYNENPFEVELVLCQPCSDGFCTTGSPPDGARESRRSAATTRSGALSRAEPPRASTPHFKVDRTLGPQPPCDELFVEAWERYALEAELDGAFACLRRKLVQFRFPIREGISQTDAYRRATRRGEGLADLEAEPGLVLEQPDQLRVVIHATPAGRIPLLITRHRADFETLIRALLRRNEPAPVPPSMGACMVAGYNNWDRVWTYRRAWEERANPASGAAWAREFKRLIPHKERYQDRFIILSDGPYSAVPAEALGLAEAEWRDLSLVIRREHECAHYVTRRLFGAMRNNVLDELIADYMGLTAATGRFRADWFLRFMGLEAFPAYRAGGRLENYRGKPALSDEAFTVLQALVVEAAHTLERFSARHEQNGPSTSHSAHVLSTLCRMTVEDLASPEADSLLKEAWSRSAQGSAVGA